MSGALRRAAVLGCGDISAVHLAALAGMPDVELVAVCDVDPGRLAEAAERWSVPGYDDHRRLLAEVRPDVVHICTPHSLHVSMALDALATGVSVVLEKPLGHTLEEGARLVEAARSSTARIGVCFQNRYNAPVRAAHELLGSGELGPILGASGTVLWHRNAAYYRDRPWRGRWETAGGGLLMNQAIHTLDLLQWLLGDVTQVSGGASTRALTEVIEVEDTAEMVLRHAGGAASVFYATLAHVVNDPVAIEVHTELATLRIRGDLTVEHAGGRVDVVREAATATGDRAYWGVSHELLIRDFYDTLDDEGAFWLDPAEALKTLAIIDEVYRQSFPAGVPAARTLRRTGSDNRLPNTNRRG
jgi:UDP-N-acetyl-2-amino-2-deoxyglucuronate dehydrogenase